MNTPTDLSDLHVCCLPVADEVVHVPDPIFTAVGVALLFSVSVRWVYDHVESGDLPCLRLGRNIRFRKSALVRWLADHAAGIPNDVVAAGPLMTPSALEAYLSQSRSWIYEARRSKRLPHFKIGNKLRFSRAMVDEWMATYADRSGRDV